LSTGSGFVDWGRVVKYRGTSGRGHVLRTALLASTALVAVATPAAAIDMVTIAGIDVLRANFDAHNIGARLEGGYRFATPAVNVTPYIAGQVQNFRTPAMPKPR
jgi:hypothetical protein